MVNRGKFFLTFFVVASILCCSGCGATTDETVKIGAIGPLTGDSAIGGIYEQVGREMVIDEVNEAGGVLGKRIELIVEDDASQPSQAAAAAMKLINQDNVVAIIGAHNSACTMALLDIVEEHGVPLITPGSTSPKITAVGNQWIARAFPNDEIQANGLIKYAVEVYGIKRPGIIYVNDDYGKNGYLMVEKYLKKRNVELVGAETFMDGDKDMSSQLTKLISKDIDALFIWCQSVPGSIIMRQARETGWTGQFFTGSGCAGPQIYELVPNECLGTILTSPFIPNLPMPSVQEFVKEFKEREKTDMDPPQNVARAYDATKLLLNAIERAGITDKEAIRQALRTTTDFPGLQGGISIDPDTGEYIGAVMVVEIVDGGGWELLDTVALED